MKQQEVFKKIGGIIAELNEQYMYLKAIDGQLNELELELFLANSNFLTDHVLILSKLNAQNAIAATKALPAPVIEAENDNHATQPHNYFEPLVSVVNPEVKSKVEETSSNTYNESSVKDKSDDTMPSINLATDSDKDSYSFIQEDEPETIRHELVLNEADMDEDEMYTTEAINDEIEEIHPIIPAPVNKLEPQPEQEPVTAQPKIEQVEEKRIVEQEKEPVKSEPITINERISAQMAAKSGVAEQLNTQSISDLKQAINLNDKMLFVKDLFNGYSLAYSEAIEILNRFNSFAEAEQFLKNNYVTKNHWDTKPETTEKLYALLKRRYA